MCGIFGFIDKSQQLSKNTLELMSQKLRHRGPDAQGTFINREKNVYLGHNRLSIIDLSANGNQPMSNENQNLWLVYNGEIYNYQEIRQYLMAKGHVFKSDSDTEVILHAYEEWGISCLEKFRGMFAFALWDNNAGKLILVRDRLGIKPLYYLDNNGVFAFASESKAFLTLKDNIWQPEINFDNLQFLLGFNFLPSNTETILQGIKKLAPGNYLILQNNQITIEPYWQLKKSRQLFNVKFADSLAEFERLLEESVRLRMRSDVPVGIMLSGGLDSSVIAALAQKNCPTKINTITASFNHKQDESHYAQLVAQHIGSNHHTLKIDTQDVSDDLEKYIGYFDDLSSFDGGLITNIILTQKIRELGVIVLLLGEGADEVLGGYSWYGLSKFPFNLLPNKIRNLLYYYSISRNLSFNPKFYWKKLNNLIKDFADQDDFDVICQLECLYQLPNHYLMKVDKGTMANATEARVPYLDHKFVEFAYNLPAKYKLRGSLYSFKKSNEKYILRQVAEKYLPPVICQRKKQGFLLPVSDVLKANLDKVHDYIFAADSLSRQLFPEKKLAKLFSKTMIKSSKPYLNAGEIEKELFLWKLWLLECWQKHYFSNH
ncbi:MAG: asparagine synthase (glutamine-hydrolyzing) [Candidatus Buchananbacteria bacterium RBG_13_36_9]|uniref:asparagine synthase (glutamine-hydrolyzing) n=1 Tax=Candidatus Buchananbacteria bacterium RBG_13_36_9 TaxID=1797530 RepID=A0A1G1XM13_9BACT|nr:MAG: asparagine synthase (glutamine-hydrolyzing) [Candidatus Buchananbacteria bacterium RBG_13_36_9]